MTTVTRTPILGGGIAFALSVFGAAVLAGSDPAINWFTIDAGGSASTAANYALIGTISQHDAGSVMTGGDYDLAGGFCGGASPAIDCPADINHDDTVGVADLLAVIGNWGACP